MTFIGALRPVLQGGRCWTVRDRARAWTSSALATYCGSETPADPAMLSCPAPRTAPRGDEGDVTSSLADRFFDGAPLWVVGVLLFAALSATAETGFRLHRRRFA